MSTRGIYGFRKNGEDKLTYNHYDSYFSYLGENIINFVNHKMPFSKIQTCDTNHLIDFLEKKYDKITSR